MKKTWKFAGLLAMAVIAAGCIPQQPQMTDAQRYELMKKQNAAKQATDNAADLRAQADTASGKNKRKLEQRAETAENQALIKNREAQRYEQSLQASSGNSMASGAGARSSFNQSTGGIREATGTARDAAATVRDVRGSMNDLKNALSGW